MLPGKGLLRDSYGNKEGKGTVRAGYGTKGTKWLWVRVQLQS